MHVFCPSHPAVIHPLRRIRPQNGKIQCRRLAIAADNRTILISSTKLQSRFKSVKRLLKTKPAKTPSADLDMGGAAVRRIDISLVDSVQRGKLTERFRLARNLESPMSDATTEGGPDDASSAAAEAYYTHAQSLSLLYSPPSSSPGDPLDSLDLIVPSKDDYNALSAALGKLVGLYRRYRAAAPRDLLYLQHHWIVLGKSLDRPVSATDWAAMCAGGMGVPLPREAVLALYENYCDDLGVWPEGGLMVGPQLQGLLQAVRAEVVAPLGSKADPRLEVWEKALSSGCGKENGGPENSGGPDGEEVMTADKFLWFLQDSQNETDVSISHVNELFARLNAGSHFKQGCVEVSRSGSTATDETSSRAASQVDQTITQEMFTGFLASDANDVFQPKAGALDEASMSQPLSHYWINTNHKAYRGQVGAQSYVAALHRGCRCLELDVWDGGGKLSNSAVVRAGKTASDSDLPFQDLLEAVKAFLSVVPDSYPIILCLENNCSIPVQRKMLLQLNEKLGGKGNMLYSPPSSLEGLEALPSPEALRGKVVLKSKRPNHDGGSTTVVNDDFDDFVDHGLGEKPIQSQDETGCEGVIVGFNQLGPLLSNECDIIEEYSPQTLFDVANEKAIEAKGEASRAKMKLLDLDPRVRRAEKLAGALSASIGASRTDLEKDRKARLADMPSAVGSSRSLMLGSSDLGLVGEEASTFDEDPEKWMVTLTVPTRDVKVQQNTRSIDNGSTTIPGPNNGENDGGGVEIQDFFHASVAQAESFSCHAFDKNTEAANATDLAKKVYEEKSAALEEAELLLYERRRENRERTMAAERAEQESRVHREHAETAKQRVKTVQSLLNNCASQAKSAETVALTAQTEADISRQRAEDAVKRAERAHSTAKRDKASADTETKKEEDLGKEAMEYKSKYEEASKNYKQAKVLLESATARLGEIEKEIEKIEGGPVFGSEYAAAKKDLPDDEDFIGEPGSVLSKHKEKMKEMKVYMKKVKDASSAKSTEDKMRKDARKSLEDIQGKVKLQARIAAAARRQADHSTSLAEQLAEYAEEEREAAKMRKIALGKATACVEKSTSHGSSVESQLLEAERAASEALKLAEACRVRADEKAKMTEAIEDTTELGSRIISCKVEKEEAAITLEAARVLQEEAESEALEAKRRLVTDMELFDKAKKDSVEAFNREKGDVLLWNRALVAYHNAVELKEEIERAESTATDLIAFEKETAAALRHAKDYRDSKVCIRKIYIPFEQATLLHGQKFKNWEKSLTLPYWHVHNFSEAAMMDIMSWGECELNQWREFNKTRITRVFSSGDSGIPFDPLLPWALGCQMVSLKNVRGNASLLVNDGRFRENGSCGYVLKPDHRNRDRSPDVLDDSCPEDEIATSDFSREFNVEILSGCNLPKPQSISKGDANIYVRMSLFDGNKEGKKQTYETKSIYCNFINPVWNETDGSKFIVSKSSMAVLLVTVWSSSSNGVDDVLIASSSVPISCSRDGYRSIQLFDEENSRRGAYGFASLLVRIRSRYILKG